MTLKHTRCGTTVDTNPASITRWHYDTGDAAGYVAYCPYCDEDLFTFETVKTARS